MPDAARPDALYAWDHGSSGREDRIHDSLRVVIAYDGSPSAATAVRAAASLFPTAGGVNPSLTIAALALRIGERLAATVGARVCSEPAALARNEEAPCNP